MMKYKIKDHDDLIRDAKNKAVLNTDLTSLEAYRKIRNKHFDRDKEVQSMREDINEIKQVLQLLVEKIK